MADRKTSAILSHIGLTGSERIICISCYLLNIETRGEFIFAMPTISDLSSLLLTQISDSFSQKRKLERVKLY